MEQGRKKGKELEKDRKIGRVGCGRERRRERKILMWKRKRESGEVEEVGKTG